MFDVREGQLSQTWVGVGAKIDLFSGGEGGGVRSKSLQNRDDCLRGVDFDAFSRTGVGESRVSSVGQFSGHSFVLEPKEHVLMQAKKKPAYLDALLERRQSSEHFSARELKKRSHMMVIDTKEFFEIEHTPVRTFGQISGHTHELKKRFHVTVIDAKKFFKHTPVLIIGGQSSGHARELKKRSYVTVIDAKEFYEHTLAVLRANVKPAHLDALTFNLQPVPERKMGVKFISLFQKSRQPFEVL